MLLRSFEEKYTLPFCAEQGVIPPCQALNAHGRSPCVSLDG